jgi:hypothetical protein
MSAHLSFVCLCVSDDQSLYVPIEGVRDTASQRRGVAHASVYPDLDGVSGSADLVTMIGALLTIVLILSVLMLVVCAAAWAIASSTGAVQSVARARVGVWVSLGAAVLAGAAVTWTNFLIDLGSTI